MSILTGILINTVAPIVGTLLSGLLGWGTVEAVKLVKTKTKNEAAAAAVGQVGELVQSVVDELNQTVVGDLKASGSKLDKSTALQIKVNAVKRIKNQLPGAVARAAEAAVGPIDSYIKSKIEQAVGQSKPLLVPFRKSAFVEGMPEKTGQAAE